MQCFYHCFSRITEQQIQTKKALSYIVACFCWNKMVLTKAILSSNQSKVNHITIYINITFGIITKNLFYAKYFVVFYDDSKFPTILAILYCSSFIFASIFCSCWYFPSICLYMEYNLTASWLYNLRMFP